MAPAPNQKWSDEQLDELCSLRASGMKVDAIAARMGASKGSVTGYLHRLRQAGDLRVPVMPPAPALASADITGLAPIDAMAELLAQGCPTVASASKRLGISISTGQRLWKRIFHDLGSQAI